MGYCTMPVTFAYLFTAYTLASVYYLIMTYDIGTPFKDSLTPEQIQLKKKSSLVRGYTFFMGMVISIVFLLLTQPYSLCERL